jgi:AraC-like DNA-binding protein
MPTIGRHPAPQPADAKAGAAIAFSIRTNERGRILAQDCPRFAAPAPAVLQPAALDRLPSAKSSTRQELGQRLARARAHLDGILDRAVSLEELASIASLSPFHLARHFKLAFGIAPIAYHRMLRLERAARMLAGGAVSVAEAAERIGYSDAVALTHAFRKHFGQAPRQWAMRAR